MLSHFAVAALLPFALAGAQQDGADPELESPEIEATAEEPEDIVVEGEADDRNVKKCRYVRGINSRIAKKVCRTKAEDEAYEKAARRQLEEMQDGQRGREMSVINNGG